MRFDKVGRAGLVTMLLNVCLGAVGGSPLDGADVNSPGGLPHAAARASWAETMLATRAALGDFETALSAAREQLGLAGLKLDPWHYSDSIKLDGGQAPLEVEFPPEINIRSGKNPLKPFVSGGATKRWTRAHNLLNWSDGVVLTLNDIRHVDAESVNYLYRAIAAPEKRTVTAYLGSQEGFAVWLNGELLLSDDTRRKCEPNQERVTLHLAKGKNHLHLKLPHRAKHVRFYFSLYPQPGDYRRQTVRIQLWQEIRKTFPTATDEFRARLAAHTTADWLDSAGTTDFERKLITEALGSPQRHPSGRLADLRRRFDALVGRNTRPDDPRWMNLLKSVWEARRPAMIERCGPIAFIKREAGGRRGTNATMLARMTGKGSAICIYNPARPDAASSDPARSDAASPDAASPDAGNSDSGVETIFDDPEGFIFDISPSYKADKLLFSYKKNVAAREDSFHIYEINSDGTGLRQLTTGRYHDVSPAYLPDGRIVFNSTRVQSFSVCQNYLAAALYTIDGDGGDPRRMEYNSLCDTTPYVLDDGSVLFTRWEYQDKNIFCTEGLWTLNPDGTRLQLYYGNTLTVPNALYGAKQIPGTRKVLCVMAAHHFPPLGGIALIDRSEGIESTRAMRCLTPEVPYRPTKGKDWRETNWQPGDVFYPWSYTDPWPVAEDLFLVSYGGPLVGGPQRYRLYLMDDTGFKVPLYEDLETSCYNPVPLVARRLPHRIPGEVPPEAKGEGRFFVHDVYRGLLEAGVERGQVKRLRVMSQIPKKYNTEGPRYSDHYPAIGEGTYYVKYNYGTVPVYEDGSAYFVVPAGVELYFQALDADGKEIRRMGTVTQITDGETQSCIGCHESRTMAPPQSPAAMARLGGKPDRIAPPPWGAGPVDFAGQVQPVLDRYCVECHQGATPDGGIDLSGDKTRLFSMAFETLVFTDGLVARYHINPGPTGNFPPLASGSYVSRLTKLIEQRHEGVKMDALGRRKIYAWIDANVPYYGTWEMTRPYTFGGRDTWLDERGKPLPWFEALKGAYLASPIPQEIADLSHTDVNLTRPEYSRLLTRYLAKSAGGRADGQEALFADETDPHYRAMLEAIRQGRDALLARPRVDMTGAVPIPQARDFGRTF